MGIAQKIIGYVTGNGAEVDANNSLKTTGPTTLAQVGFGAIAARNDDGALTGTPTVRRIWATETGHLIVAQQMLLWDDTFNATAQNTAKYKFGATTQTAAQAGSFLILNNSGITTANTNSGVQTWRTFPVFGNHETRVIFSGGFATATDHVPNNLTEFGLFTADIVTRVAPTDGVFFRYNQANELRGVISWGGVETQTAALTKPATNVNHDWMIIIQNDTISFWIDRVKVGSITLTTDAPAAGQPTFQAALPITIRQYIGATPPSSATKLQISDVFVKIIGPDSGRTWAEAKAGMGHMAYQGQNGGTMGTTQQNANNTNPTTAVPTNTTAALGSGLGGLFQETLTLAAGTDGIIQSFQVPQGTINQTPRNLVIRAIKISGVVTVALTTSPLAGTMSLNFGHTAVSLATAEGTSFGTSPTTKAPRRIALTTTSLVSATSAAGTPVVVGNAGVITFDSPIVVAPGEFVAVSHKKISTAPATGSIMWTITFVAYYE